MRIMEIPRFPRRVKIPDFNYFIRSRLTRTVVLWPDQAIALAGYACWPNDEARRRQLVGSLQGWGHGVLDVPAKIPRIQHEWLRVADVLHHRYDLAAGGHQERRGGASIGKAVSLVAGMARSRGTGEPNLWRLWKKYKDVAHVVSAACLLCAEVHTMSGGKRFGPDGLSPDQFGPFQMIMFMPDFVLAVARDFESHGLTNVPHARNEPTLDPQTLWRIPPDINVVPVRPPVRSITKKGLRTLNARRAGNRGKAKKPGSPS